MEDILQQLLEALEEIGKQHSELYDTDVREQVFEAVYNGFIEPRSGYVLPAKYGLYDEAANAAVRAAIARYIAQAGAHAAATGVDTPRARLAAFQNPNVHTRDE